MPSITFLSSGLGSFHSPAAEPHHAPDLRLEPSHLELELTLDIDGRRAHGRVVHTLVARTEGPREVTLNAVGLVITQVRDADDYLLTWSYDGQRLVVLWADGIPRADARRLEVEWSVEQPLTGLMFSGPDAMYPGAPRWAATDHETERARHWLPCVDHPSVRTTLDIAVRAERDLTILGPGLLLREEDHGDGTKTAHWHLDQPCPSYLLCISVGDYARHDAESVDGREIAYFAPAPFTADDLGLTFAPTPKMMRWMQDRLGVAFPYPKYFQFATYGIGGAMENISLVSWEARFMMDALYHQECGWRVDIVNLHEMAHSYFGDHIVCRDFSHTWLKESWAVYMESVWLHDTAGDDARDFHLHENRCAYFAESDTNYARPIVTRVFDSSWDMFDRHLYPGGAVRLHMLRCRLGDDDFWAGVTTYIEQYGGGVAETSDFRRVMEQASGQTLTKFFDQWLHSPGYPKLKASFSWSGERGEGSLTIEQTQVDTKQGIGLFDLPLDVAFETPSGWVTRRIDISQDRHVLSLPLAARPTQVVLDPEGALVFGLEFAPGEDLLTRQLTSGPSMAARLQAASLLTKKPTRAAISALHATAASDPFWGLRLAIGRHLGRVGTRGAANALADLLLRESDPQVMGTLTLAAGQMREPSLEDALREWLGRPARPYIAAANAFTSLGAQRGDMAANEALLLAGVEDTSLHGLRRRGALQGLAAQRTRAGREVLMTRMSYGADSHYVRGIAAEAFGQSARYGDAAEREDAVGRLTDLTRDPDYKVRMAAVRGLAALGEASGRRGIAAVESTLATQDVPRVRRAGLRLAGSGKATPTAKATKRAEAMEDQIRELRHRLDALESGATSPASSQAD